MNFHKTDYLYSRKSENFSQKASSIEEYQVEVNDHLSSIHSRSLHIVKSVWQANSPLISHQFAEDRATCQTDRTILAKRDIDKNLSKC
jgi:hypothetical protein